MRKYLVILAVLAVSVHAKAASPFDSLDLSRTLRLDYVFSGTDKTQEIALARLSSYEGWAGRRVNMDRSALRGNGRIEMKSLSGQLLYVNTFSTLFQEWQATEEATRVRKSFENVFLLPMPGDKATVTVRLYDVMGKACAELTHTVDPDDILIRPAGDPHVPFMYVWKGGDPSEKIDVAIVAEGYTPAETGRFYSDASAAVESFWKHEPFASMKDRFNFVAVAPPSQDSGVSVPREGNWKNTAVASSFDTFYSDRYLTTLNLFDLHDLLAAIPYEHIIILANTETYGGGGIFNSYTLTAAHHKLFAPVVVHEFGHSFAGLADEYYYDDQYSELYYPGVEPWEPNITTKADFPSKWADMMDMEGVGLFEGGGYQSRGVWRPSGNCRMKTNEHPSFCPVCQRAIARMIDFYTIFATQN